jgi:hypothetical protein
LPKAPGVCRRTSGAPAAAATAAEEEEEEEEAEEAEAAAAAPPRDDVARACAAVDLARCDIEKFAILSAHAKGWIRAGVVCL